jgi:hypothetical protein
VGRFAPLLDINHVAALIQTTPKNVRNYVARKKGLPEMVTKPKMRSNKVYQWKKDVMLAFVEEHYAHLYE